MFWRTVLLGILHGKMLNCKFSILFSKQKKFFSGWQYLKEATELKRHRRAAEMMSRGEGHPCRIKLHFLKNHQVIISSGEWAGTCLGKTCSPMKDSPHHSAILVHVYSAKQEISLRTAASKKNIFRPIALQQHISAVQSALFVVFYACLSSYPTKLLSSRFYGVHIFIPIDAPATGLL